MARPSTLSSIAASPDAQGLNDHVGVRIVRISDALNRIATRVIEGRWGLRNTDLRLMNILDQSDPLPVSEISRRAHVDKAWVSRSLRALEHRGLVERCADPADTRLTLFVLTDHGQALLEEVRPHALRGELGLLEGIDGRRLKRMLDRLEANAVAQLERE
jgi:DNA-binding MarR family transcriptional regulator